MNGNKYKTRGFIQFQREINDLESDLEGSNAIIEFPTKDIT